MALKVDGIDLSGRNKNGIEPVLGAGRGNCTGIEPAAVLGFSTFPPSLHPKKIISAIAQKGDVAQGLLTQIEFGS